MIDPVQISDLNHWGADWEVLASFCVACSALASLITWVWNRGGKSAILAQEVKLGEDALARAISRADRIQASYDKLLGDMHDHELRDATDFAELRSATGEATRTTIASEARLSTALDNLGKRLDTMTTRFDEFMTVFARILPHSTP